MLELGVSGARPMLSTVMNPASEYSITGDGTGEARRSRSPRYSSDSHKGAVYKFGRGGKGAASLHTHLWTQSHTKMYYYFPISSIYPSLQSDMLSVACNNELNTYQELKLVLSYISYYCDECVTDNELRV